jgi:hypothetical protein
MCRHPDPPHESGPEPTAVPATVAALGCHEDRRSSGTGGGMRVKTRAAAGRACISVADAVERLLLAERAVPCPIRCANNERVEDLAAAT